MRMPAERPSSSLMFFRLFSASSTVLPAAENTNQPLSDVCIRGCCLCVCVRVQRCGPYVRKSLTSSTVISPVVSKVRSAQLRGESRGESRTGEERELGCSSCWPGEQEAVRSVTLLFGLAPPQELEGPLGRRVQALRRLFIYLNQTRECKRRNPTLIILKIPKEKR